VATVAYRKINESGELMARELRVDAEVAKHLPAAMLAQLQATIDDPDNVCCICAETISGSSAEVARSAESR
jgi:hypothetical protein